MKRKTTKRLVPKSARKPRGPFAKIQSVMVEARTWPDKSDASFIVTFCRWRTNTPQAARKLTGFISRPYYRPTKSSLGRCFRAQSTLIQNNRSDETRLEELVNEYASLHPGTSD